ncbi:hypothetical protein [Streptomyces sp. NRRL F-4474]|nr:hypothetical protein [Streptomyces sp. NRRL F-4474]
MGATASQTMSMAPSTGGSVTTPSMTAIAPAECRTSAPIARASTPSRVT